MTELFLKLLGVRVNDAVHIAKASLSFGGGVGRGWLFLLFLVLVGVTWWSYRLSPVHVSTARKIALSLLRLVFVGLLLLLFVRPVLSFTVEGSVRRLLVMLVDTSSSMQIKDPRIDPADQKRVAIAKNLVDPARGLNQNVPASQRAEVDQIPRIEVARAALKNQRLDLLPHLDREFDLEAFAFAQGVAGLSAERESTNNAKASQLTWVDRLSATNPATAIGDALREIINRKRGQPLAGVVLVTDGANNSGSQPREVAAMLRQENVPLYIYGVGITSPRDIIVANIFAPDVTFVKDDVTATVRVRGQGLTGQSAEVVLKLGDQTVATKAISFNGDGEQVVPMHFVPPSAGEFDLQASIEPRADETVKDNNSFSQRLKVIDAKIKVLLVDQSPRWEFRYLQAMLLRDRRIDLKCYLVEGDPRIAREGSPYLSQFPSRKDELFNYDLVVFGDVDPKHISGAQLENLSEFVSKFGGAMVMVAGKRFSPAAYRRSVMEKMLPVEFDSPSIESSSQDPTAEKPIRLELTAAGRSNPMLRLSDKDDENIALWKQLPPLYWVAKVSRPKPAAEVLLVDPDPARESRFGKMPVIAVQKYGLGQVMYVGTDNTWRWRRNVGDMYYTALWGQIAQRVSMQHLLGVSKRTQLTADRQNYVTGDRVTVYARLYAEGYEPVQEASVKGIYGIKSGQGPRSELNLRPIPDQPGLYRGEFIAPAPGAYSFFVEQDLNSPLDFSVTEPRFELGETAMNESLLRELASTTAGGFFREEDLYKLPQTISQKTERVQSPLEVELWASPLYFALMLLVVAGEWVLRKMSHLK